MREDQRFFILREAGRGKKKYTQNKSPEMRVITTDVCMDTTFVPGPSRKFRAPLENHQLTHAFERRRWIGTAPDTSALDDQESTEILVQIWSSHTQSPIKT